MHILLIEASLTGHHSIYLERTALAYLNAGHSVTIALPVGISNAATVRSNLVQHQRVNWVEYLPSFELDNTSVFGLVLREYNVRKVFGRVYRVVHADNPVDYVFLPYIDYCLYSLGLIGTPFGSSRFGGICMRPAFHYSEIGVVAPSSRLNAIKKYLFFRLLSNEAVFKVFSIDETLYQYTNGDGSSAKYPLHFLPDPAGEPQVADVEKVRAKFSTPLEARVILVYGALNERKGISDLLDTLENKGNNSNWHIWLIGRQSCELEALLKSDRWATLKAANKLHVKNAFVDTTTEQEVLTSCDIVWVKYKGHTGMSGVLVHAGKHSKPVVASNDGLIGWHVRKWNLGITTDDSWTSIFSALESAYMNSIALGENASKKFKNNTWKNFDDAISVI